MTADYYFPINIGWPFKMSCTLTDKRGYLFVIIHYDSVEILHWDFCRVSPRLRWALEGADCLSAAGSYAPVWLEQPSCHEHHI